MVLSGTSRTVIAVMPQIAVATRSMAPTAPPSSSASIETAQPFSAALQQVQTPPLDSTVSSPNEPEVKRSDFKSSESKTNDSQGRSIESGQTSTSKREAKSSDSVGQTLVSTPASQSIEVSSVVVQPTPGLDWKLAMNDLTPDVHVPVPDLNHAKPNDSGKSSPGSGVDLPAESYAIGGSTLPQARFEDKDIVPTEQQGDGANLQKSADAGAKDSIQKESAGRLITSLSGTPASDSKTQPGSAPVPLRDISPGGRETDDNRTPAVSQGDQFAVPLSVVLPAIVFPTPAPGNVDSSNSSSQDPALKPALSETRASATPASGTQEVAGAARKNVDVIGGAKNQPRKDDSPASANSQASDQSKGSAPAKALETSSSFPEAANQPPSTGMPGDGKNASATVFPNASDQKASQFDQESIGVAQSQTQPETQAAYPTSIINSAKLVERIGEAELRLGIRAGEFGSVDIRTSMVRNQFTAEISVERGELGRVIAAELPSLQNRLMEQRVPVANITVQNHTGSHSTASEQQKSRDGQQVYATNSGSLEEGLTLALVALEGTASPSRLDVHM